mmetsp:Transcript_26166/g.50087  ORF Transcript_26166/g.50087 Transcript_26166/m.50087 type:complete len:110 (+) Transcript_26166:224-553(+)
MQCWEAHVILFLAAFVSMKFLQVTSSEPKGDLQHCTSHTSSVTHALRQWWHRQQQQQQQQRPAASISGAVCQICGKKNILAPQLGPTLANRPDGSGTLSPSHVPHPTNP